MSFDLTTLLVTAPVRLLHLSDVCPVHPMRAQFTQCDTGALPTVGWQLLPLPVSHDGSFCWRAALLRCGPSLHRTRLFFYFFIFFVPKLSSERELSSNVPGIVDNTSNVEFGGQPECLESRDIWDYFQEIDG